MRCVILLGAGASFGSGDAYRLQDEHKICTPPLGKNLFKLLEAEGGVAASLPSWIKEVFACDFEEGMKEFSQAYPYDLIHFQRELARFLASFCPGQQNTYLKMLKKLIYHDVIYSSLNYDLLLECSASRFQRHISYTTNHGSNSINILKLHGSVNFWPDFNAKFTDVKIGNSPFNVIGPIVVLDHQKTLAKCNSNTSLQPAIAVFAAGKKVTTCPGFITDQQNMWRREITEASVIFICGVRVHEVDSHIWVPLSKTRSPIIYFGQEGDRPEFISWRNKSNKENAYFEAATFEQSISIMKRKLDGLMPSPIKRLSSASSAPRR